MSAEARGQCLETLLHEDFEAGVIPSGWTATGTWTVATTAQGTCVDCAEGFAVSTTGPTGVCLCDLYDYPCQGLTLESPPIALPTLAPGETLSLDFCYSAYLDGYCDGSVTSCNRVEVVSASATVAYALGPHILSGCPGPFVDPPYDLSAFSGQVVTIRWAIGCVDEEGLLRFGVDRVRLYRTFTTGVDCNANFLPDACEVRSGISRDCNANLVPDACELASGAELDCNANGTPDSCDVAAGFEQDCDADGLLDSCAVASGSAPDCNANGVPDACDIALGTSYEFDDDGVPDECACTITHTYCLGGINSLGTRAVIGYEGATSITAGELTLTVEDAHPGQLGLFFVGPLKTQITFGSGFLCVGGPLDRFVPPVLLDEQGAAALLLDFMDPDSPLAGTQPYSLRSFQFWYRDPGSAGSPFNLSDGLRMHFCP